MLRETPLVEGETYHIFNRGAHKQPIFLDEADYLRAQMLMFLHNDTRAIVMRDLLAKYKGRSYVEIFKEEKSSKCLVDVLVYSLMPNHFHLVLRQLVSGGITSFMKKFCTAYSMYFNAKYGHSGVVFQGRFRSSHVDTEPYHRYIFSYVHLNPISLIEPEWEENGLQNDAKVRSFLPDYKYSSYYDYSVDRRPERAILAENDIPEFLSQQNDLEDLIRWSRPHVLYT